MAEHKHDGAVGCRSAFKKMSDYIDRELDGKNLDFLEKHLSSCPACLVVLKTLRKTIELFKGKPADEPPEDAVNRLNAELKERIEKNPVENGR